MMTGPIDYYARFRDLGFNAGLTIKGPWKSKDDVYTVLQSHIPVEKTNLVAPLQRHGSDIEIVDKYECNKKPAADGVLSKNSDLCLTVKTADCLPILLAEPNSGLFGAVHVGWRGLAGGIIENLMILVKKLDIDFNRLYIHLGPCIGDCCFEIGGDVAVLFDNEYARMQNGRYYLDTRGQVRNKLLSSGVSNSKIMDLAECTSCLNSRYYSFRRDREAPIQMISFICGKKQREVKL